MLNFKRLIDISQPVRSSSAVFPGDTPFHADLTLTYSDSKIVNLTKFTMSPHVGTHIDAPSHIKGDMQNENEHAGALQLEAFIGAALVLDLAPRLKGIDWPAVEDKLNKYQNLPPRILFRTQSEIQYDVFADDYSYFECDLINELSKRGVRLIGIDTPSADHINSKRLDAHHELDKHKMVWLENLDLTQVSEGEYNLIALPLKFMELEASPTRAVLLVI